MGDKKRERGRGGEGDDRSVGDELEWRGGGEGGTMPEIEMQGRGRRREGRWG